MNHIFTLLISFLLLSFSSYSQSIMTEQTPPFDTQVNYDINVSSTLSVEMESVELNCTENRITMTWVSAAENNCDYYKIEKSRNGVEYDLESIVEGHGTTRKTHSYEHKSWFFDIEHYYRLVEVDLNGNETFFGPFHIDCVKDVLIVSLNPSEHFIEISYSGFHSNETTILCLDHTGRKVVESSCNSKGKTTIDIDHLSSGIYTLIVQDLHHTETTEFTIL